ncbi:MAG: hypothetical protein ABIH26_14550 [Candidatus Eisenbacteria bacterium]
MRRVPFPVFAALLAALLAPAAARAEEEPGDEFEKVRTDSVWVVGIEGESLWVDSLAADSIRTFVVEDSLSKIPSVRIENVSRGFHPMYEIQASFIRSTTNISNIFTLDYLLRDNLLAKTRTTWEKRRADRANRESGIRRTEVELQYLLWEGVRVGLRYGRDDNREQDDLRSTDTNLNRLLLQSTFIRELPKSLRLTMTLEGGIETRDKDEEQRPTTEGGSPTTRWEKKRGNALNSAVGLEYQPRQTLNVNVQGSAARNSFSIETAGGQSGDSRSDDNRDATDAVSSTVRLDDFDFAKISLNMRAERSRRSFARPAGGVETATDRRRSADFVMKGAAGARTEYEARLDYAWGSRRFAIDAAQSSERLDYGAETSVAYRLPASIKSKLTMKRSVTEDKYFPKAGEPDATGETERGSVLLNLSRPLWAYTQLRTTGSIGLTSRVYVDSTQDRDNADRRIAADLDFSPPGKIRGSASFSVDEGRTVNIDRTRSANNETRQTWRVSPTINYQVLPNVKLNSAYTMTLIYIFKEADSSRNTMTRISELRSVIDWDISAAARFALEYRYKLDESGSFQKEGTTRRFSRSREGETQNLNMKVSYRIGQGFSFETGQFVQVEKLFTLSEGKELDSEKKKAQIYTQLMFRKELSKKTRLNIKARQIQDASVPIFPVGTGSRGGEQRRVDWELNGGLSFKL